MKARVIERLVELGFREDFRAYHFGEWIFSDLAHSEDQAFVELHASGVFGPFPSIDVSRDGPSAIFKVRATMGEEELDRFARLLELARGTAGDRVT